MSKTTTVELSDDLVQVVDGNTDYNELYWEIHVLGMKVASYGGNDVDVRAWAKKRSGEVRAELLRFLKKHGWRKEQA